MAMVREDAYQTKTGSPIQALPSRSPDCNGIAFDYCRLGAAAVADITGAHFAGPQRRNASALSILDQLAQSDRTCGPVQQPLLGFTAVRAVMSLSPQSGEMGTAKRSRCRRDSLTRRVVSPASSPMGMPLGTGCMKISTSRS